MRVIEILTNTLDARRPLSRKFFLLNSLYLFLLTIAIGMLIALTGLVNSLVLGRIAADISYLFWIQLQCRRFTDVGFPRWIPWIGAFFWWLWKYQKISTPGAIEFATNAHGLISISVLVACLALPSAWRKR